MDEVGCSLAGVNAMQHPTHIPFGAFVFAGAVVLFIMATRCEVQNSENYIFS
jgi:hypothetical protein